MSSFVTDTSESIGQSSCRPVQDIKLWENPKNYSFNIGSQLQNIQPTDIDMVGKYAYITSNTSSSSDPDFIILDISDISSPVIVSYLNTGPGLLSIHVAGNYAYVGNSSVNSQLQIIDIVDKAHPRIVSSYKLPGIYNDATTVGNVVFYKNNIVYLGTQKSDIAELHAIDVSLPNYPHEVSSYEIGSAINDIFAFKDKVYVASPGSVELKIFSFISNKLAPISSFNVPEGLGNGKRLSLFLDNLYLGRTVGKDELYALGVSSSMPSTLFHYLVGSSIHGVLCYGKLLFVLSSKNSDGFLVFDISNHSALRINTIPIYFSGSPINFDCDQNMFGVVFDNNSTISFITHS